MTIPVPPRLLLAEVSGSVSSPIRDAVRHELGRLDASNSMPNSAVSLRPISDAGHLLHEGFSLGFQDVAGGYLNHFVPNLVSVPFPLNLHKRVLRACGILSHDCPDGIEHFHVDDRDGFDQRPVAFKPDEELGLFAAMAAVVVWFVGCQCNRSIWSRQPDSHRRISKQR